jgi:ketosteroid isomerase-like protein
MGALLDGVTQDELFIRRMLERYMRFHDDRVLDGVVSVFAPEAVFRTAGQVLDGREEIREFFARSGYRNDQPSWTDDDEQLRVMPRSMHIMVNPIINIAGDVATAESEFVYVVREESGRAKMVLVGRYRDRLRRDDQAGWLIVQRTGVSIARQTDPPGHQEPLPLTAVARAEKVPQS